MLCSLLRFSCRAMGARSELDLILRRDGIILRRNGFKVTIIDDFFGAGACNGRLTLTYAYEVYP